MAATAAPADRLSGLPDNVLQRVLSFAPTKEAAATAVLSRRWRTLWLRAGVVNLDPRSWSPNGGDGRRRPSADTLNASFRAALAPFRNGRSHLKKLDMSQADDPVNIWDLLANPATSTLQELRVDCKDMNFLIGHEYGDTAARLASMLCAATLRVLDLKSCNLEPPAPEQPSSSGLAFPCLTSLGLRNCVLSHGYLQLLVDAAPALASLRLENVRHDSPEPTAYSWQHPSFRLCFGLRCPMVSDFVLDTTCQHQMNKDELAPSSGGVIDLDMPNLRFFRYRGFPARLSLRSPAPKLARVDLDGSCREGCQEWYEFKGELKARLPRMLTGLLQTRVLKLRVPCIEDLLAGGKQEDGQVTAVLPVFPNLDVLDLEGDYKCNNKKTAEAMASLLASCPAVSKIRLRLSMKQEFRWDQESDLDGEQIARRSFRRSVERLERFSSPSFHCTAKDSCEILEHATLSQRTFSCLENSLRVVVLQFKVKELNSFEVQLTKFLAENAVHLEEMRIDDGIQVYSDHLHNRVAKWRANSFERKKLPNTGRFDVYHLSKLQQWEKTA